MLIHHFLLGGSGGQSQIPQTWEFYFACCQDIYTDLLTVIIVGTNNDFVLPIANSGLSVTTPATPAILTGVQGGVFGRWFAIAHEGTTGELIVLHESGLSLAQNRFRLPNNNDFRIRPNFTAIFRYNDVIQRWNLVSR